MALEKLLTPKEAAKWLGISIATLRGWRREGRGPTVMKLTQKTYRYSEDSLREYIEALRTGRVTLVGRPNGYLPAGTSFVCSRCGCEFRGKACPGCNQEPNASTEVVSII